MADFSGLVHSALGGVPTLPHAPWVNAQVRSVNWFLTLL